MMINSSRLYKYSFVLVLLILASFARGKEIYQAHYNGFTLWIDCDLRGAIMFRYNAQRDTGNFKRHSKFYLDDTAQIPDRCLQKSTSSYKAPDQSYDRGHLVPANHLDYDKLAIKQSNYMSNILPQASNLNRGAWLASEELIECYRDIDELLVIGGALFDEDTSRDFFVASHGVRTPSSFWKVVIRNDRVIAWLMPNSKDAKRSMLDHYLVSVAEIENVTGITIPVENYLKGAKAGSSWIIPIGCNKG